MDRVYVFLIRNDIWIYILCGLSLFWYGGEWLRAQGQLRRAMFNLERERALRRRNNAVALSLLSALIAGGVAFVNIQIAPSLPAELLLAPTPTPDPARRPLASPTPPLVPTITLPGQIAPPGPGETAAPPDASPAATTPGDVTATPPPIVSSSCSSAINFSLPLDGSLVTGLVTFTGSASAPGFSFYKLEVNGPQTGGAWASLLGRTVFQPTVNGVLGSADFGGWLPGSYAVRLVVVDDTSNEVGSCVIRLEVEG